MTFQLPSVLQTLQYITISRPLMLLLLALPTPVPRPTYGHAAGAISDPCTASAADPTRMGVSGFRATVTETPSGRGQRERCEMAGMHSGLVVTRWGPGSDPGTCDEEGRWWWFKRAVLSSVGVSAFAVWAPAVIVTRWREVRYEQKGGRVPVDGLERS